VRGPLAEILGKSYEKAERNQEIDHLRDTIVKQNLQVKMKVSSQDVKTAFDNPIQESGPAAHHPGRYPARWSQASTRFARSGARST
jgi:hypothetical protein